MLKALRIFLKVIFVVTALLGAFFVTDFFWGYGEKPVREKPLVLATNSSPSASGGIWAYMKQMHEAPELDAYEFVWGMSEDSKRYDIAKADGIEVAPMTFLFKLKRFLGTLRSLWQTRQLCKQLRPDIIHANDSPSNTVVCWATLFMRDSIPIVRTFHLSKRVGPDPYHWMLYEKLNAATIFVAQGSFEQNLELGGLELDNAVIIENGIDPDYYQPRPKDTALMKTLGIPQDVFVFGTNAGLGSYKRPDMLVRAAALLGDEYDFRILLLGSADAYENLKRLAADLGVADKLVYGGYVNDVRPAVSLFDVVFLLSDNVETASYAIREAMGMGVPVLSTPYSGLKDNVDEGLNGFLVPVNNPEATAQAMIKFLEMPKEQLEAMGKHSREKAIRQFSKKDQMTAIAKLYEKLLNES